MRIPAGPLAIVAVLLGVYLGGYHAIGSGMLVSTRVPLAKPKDVPSVRVATYGVPGVRVGAVVRMSPYAFVPREVTVRRGEAVEFRNVATAMQRPMSDPHPGHGGNAALDADGFVEPGRSWYAVMDEAGTFPVHDEVYPSVRGTVTVR